VPEFSTRRLREITGVSSWQILQTAPDAVTVRLQIATPPSESQRLAVAQYVRDTLKAFVSVEVQAVDGFTKTKGGKFYPAVRAF